MKLKNLFQKDDDRAVSPVIGVILMVAITVILAAVIGTFVLGLGEDIEQNVQAGATVNQDVSNDQITVTWTSQGNADGLIIRNSSGTVQGSNITNVGGQIVIGTPTAGSTYTVTAFQGTDTNPNRETVIRTFTVDDGF